MLGALVAAPPTARRSSARARSRGRRARARGGRPAGGRGGRRSLRSFVTRRRALTKGRGAGLSRAPRYHPPWPATCSPTHFVGDPGGSTAAGSTDPGPRAAPRAFFRRLRADLLLLPCRRAHTVPSSLVAVQSGTRPLHAVRWDQCARSVGECCARRVEGDRRAAYPRATTYDPAHTSHPIGAPPPWQQRAASPWPAAQEPRLARSSPAGPRPRRSRRQGCGQEGTRRRRPRRRRLPAKKAAAKKAPAKKAPAKKAPAKKAARRPGQEGAAKKAPAKKAPAKKAPGQEGSREEGSRQEDCREEGSREEARRRRRLPRRRRPRRRRPRRRLPRRRHPPRRRRSGEEGIGREEGRGPGGHEAATKPAAAPAS